MKEEKPIILVVEDETDVLRINARMVIRRGYTVYTAENCRQAYERMEAPTPDLLILDIMLPDVNGYDLLEYCKSLEVPVIFLTALGGVEDRVRGLRSGAEDYLPKPFALPELLARVETVLRRCGKAERLLTLEPDIEIDPAARIVRKKRQPRGPDGQGVRSAPAVRAEPEHRPLPGPHL